MTATIVAALASVGLGAGLATAKATDPGLGRIHHVGEAPLPRGDAPSVLDLTEARTGLGLLGAADGIARPPFVDRRQRMLLSDIPRPFGHTLAVGEVFRFDVSYAGNPAGLAEAGVVSLDPDARGGALLKLEGHASTSGVASLLATVSDDLMSLVDARTGAPVLTTNVVEYKGIRWKYKRRMTTTTHEGRGQMRIVDDRDGKTKKRVRKVPLDTFDPLSAMAWVRSLELAPGERAKAHALDGSILLRIEIVARGPDRPKPLPSIASALEIQPGQVTMLEGTLTRVDEHDQPIVGKQVYKMRAWITNDARRIPLVLETDMWLGSLRLELRHYDPPMR